MSCFSGNFMHECKVLFQIKLLSFKSFSSVISSLISVVENAASNVIYMALPRLQGCSRCLTKSSSFACQRTCQLGCELLQQLLNVTQLLALQFLYQIFSMLLTGLSSWQPLQWLWRDPTWEHSTGSLDSELGFCLMPWNSSQTNDIPNETAGFGAKCW